MPRPDRHRDLLTAAWKAFAERGYERAAVRSTVTASAQHVDVLSRSAVMMAVPVAGLPWCRGVLQQAVFAPIQRFAQSSSRFDRPADIRVPSPLSPWTGS